MLLKTMIDAIEQHFQVEELRTSAVEFAVFKSEGKFPFGELTVLHYQMFGGTSSAIYEAAAAIELLILALDIFDDVQDQDQPAVPWSKLDPALAINIAIGMLMLGGQLLSQADFDERRKLKALYYYNSQAVKAVNGQHVDLLDSVETEEEYLHAIINRSASLVICACLVGSTLVDEGSNAIVEKYAAQIGIMAQLKNDKNDICNLDGKNDLFARKRTLPTLYLLNLENERSQIIRDYFVGSLQYDQVEAKKKELYELITESGCLDYINIKIEEHKMEAVNYIKLLEISHEWTIKLEEKL